MAGGKFPRQIAAAMMGGVIAGFDLPTHDVLAGQHPPTRRWATRAAFGNLNGPPSPDTLHRFDDGRRSYSSINSAGVWGRHQ